ncbi:MAG: GldG family protein [Thermoanaerobaculales bacterium]|nr:GldG family protein [Thermoanaerobaculales bacterium]
MRTQDLRRFSTGGAAVVLAVVLLLMANWLGTRHWKRADWTASHLYSLSEKSRNIVGDIDEEIRVIVFMTPGSGLYPQVRELLNRYEAVSDNIKLEYIDPEREPLRTQQLAEEFGISLANTVVFTAGERSKYVTSDQMAEFDYSGMRMGQAPTLKAFKGEEQFTSAILSLVAPSVPKVYFVTGHGEPSASSPGGLSERGISLLKENLKRENMETAEVTLLSGSVPEDADVLAIIGPTRAFTEAEIQALESYLRGDGRLLAALDPLIEPDGSMRGTRLEDLFARWDIDVRNDLVIDPSKKLPFYDLSAVYLDAYGDHPIVQGMEGMAVLFMVARSVAPAPEPQGLATVLVETSAEGWGETNLSQLLRGEPVAPDDEDASGPISVAVAVEIFSEDPGAETEEDGGEESTAGTRLVILGDSDFLSDSEISNAGNLVLAVNSFSWLASQEHSLGIPPRDVEQVSLFLSSAQMNAILLIILVLMPGTAVVAGILVWRRRRH